ncbi:MAG: hypothetical protein LBU83_06570 [Bacteroidales bacterium]|jgi:uncharacterized protein YfeS|nr:hypothetical protein [Bacteroidales bacterium]
MISEYVRQNKSFNFTANPKEQVEIDWEMPYYPADDISREAVEALLNTEDGERDQCNSDMVTYATAFAQIKITGRIDAELKQMALNAMKRMDIAFEIIGDSFTRESLLETQSKMIKDLEAFTAWKHQLREKMLNDYKLFQQFVESRHPDPDDEILDFAQYICDYLDQAKHSDNDLKLLISTLANWVDKNNLKDKEILDLTWGCEFYDLLLNLGCKVQELEHWNVDLNQLYENLKKAKFELGVE